jgi:hypothetical protein
MAASPTASASALPTLTPKATPGPDRGTWTRVKGSKLASPNAVGVLAGDRGVLLLEKTSWEWADDHYDLISDMPCAPPERHGGGTRATFYDARTHAITRVSDKVLLQEFATASLADGRVLIAGGYDPKDESGRPTRRTRIWDPSTREWAEGSPMGIGRARPFLVTLADGRVMAAGGSVAADDEECDEQDCEGIETETLSAELYDPVTNRWRPTSAVSLEDTDGEAAELYGLVGLSSGQVLADGDTTALYDPATGAWTAAAGVLGSWPLALPDGTVLSFDSEYFGADAEEEVPFAARFDPSGSTTIVGHLSPDGPTNAVLADGRVFIAGGVVEDEEGYLGVFLARAEVFDPDTGLLSEVASMPAVRFASTVVPLDDGSVLVVGGVDVWESQAGEDIPGCVPVKYRVVRWVP